MSSTNNLLKDQAIALIVQGLSTSQIAAACGVDDSYISQLRADPAVASAAAAAGVELTLADMQFDSKLEKAENMALEKIESGLRFANMGQALQAFRILNGAKKRKDTGVVPGTAPGVSVTVNLTLPASVLTNYVTNSSNEIIEVEGKTMISATAKSLDQILAARAGTTQSAALPQLTGLERAAMKLDGLRPPVYRAPRRLPTELSADVL